MSLLLFSANVSIVGSARYRYFHGRSLFACRFASLLILLIIYESLRMGATFLPLHMFNLFKFSQAISACLGIKSPENFSFTLIRKYLQQLIINADKQSANKERVKSSYRFPLVFIHFFDLLAISAICIRF